MGDTSETNTKVLSRELFLGVVALKRLYRKIIICAIRSLFSNPVTYVYYVKSVNISRSLLFHVFIYMCVCTMLRVLICQGVYYFMCLYIYEYTVLRVLICQGVYYFMCLYICVLC